MNKSSLIKTILVIMMGMILIFSTSVFAADDVDDVDDLFFSDEIITGTDEPSSTKAKDTTGLSGDKEELTVEDTSSSKEKTPESTSVYEESKTPETISKAGIEDSIPMVLIGVFAVSAIYAFKKINDYKNI